jgi:8-oxo-dGTP pyrophosphatase MutT (NUDIX family)
VGDSEEGSVVEQAFGAVVFDAEGRVLLVEPLNHYAGYFWTFPKGRPDGGEEPRETALRELREEAGYTARVAEVVPGVWPGETTETRYFLMNSPKRVGDFKEDESVSICWASPEEARRKLAMTRNVVGRERDLAVLEKALSLKDEVCRMKDEGRTF